MTASDKPHLSQRMLAEEITDIDSILKELGIFLQDAEFSRGGKKGDKGREKCTDDGLPEAAKPLFTALGFKGKVLCLNSSLHDPEADWTIGQLQAPSIQCAQTHWA
jgi:hypothetical protein